MKLRLSKAVFVTAVSLLSSAVHALPSAPAGYKWELVEHLSDEFNDNNIDDSKWYKYNTTWVGRSPGRFKPAQVSEQGGFLRLQNTKVADTNKDVWVHTGFLSSKTETFTAGMYSEARFKAAKDGTVTGFWMSAPGHTEIDVQEAVGYSPNGNQRLPELMRMNTHYHPNGWATDKTTQEDHAIAAVGDNFHVYGVWWKDTRNLSYFHNGQWVTNVYTGGEFDRGMKININTETQDWLGDPLPWRLNNNNMNYTLVDYVRTWKLVPDTDSPSVGDTVHLLKRNATGFAIDGNVNGANGQNVYLWEENSANVNQNWIEIDRGNGYYSYQKVDTNFCLDGGNGGSNGQTVYLWSCNTNNQNQHWLKVNVGGEHYRLQKRNAPAYSIDGGNGGAKLQDVYLWASDNNNRNQHWSFESGAY